MSIRPIVRSTLSAACLTVLVAAFSDGAFAAQNDGARRNIVFFLVDDLRYDALGLINPYWRTPNMDALARGGVLFQNAYVTTSLCSPSRASILSGQYAHKHGVLDNETPLPPGVPTFPESLRAAGYETAFVGKWHMGGASDEPRPGFDRWVSFRGQGVYENPTFNIDGERVAREGYTTDLITEYSVEFLRKPRTKPFLLYVSHKAVHSPFTAAARHKGAYADTRYPYPASMADTEANYRGKPEWVRRQRNSWHGVDGMYNKTTDMDTFVKDYAETLLAVDEGLGRIMGALRDLGLFDSTLIVFTSDNGFQFGEHGLIDKRTMYEASARVPLIVHCPELFPGGTRRSELVLNVDFAPTFLDAAGLTVPETMQGRSFYPLLGGAQAEWREAFLYEYFWERSFPQTPTVFGVRAGRYKLMQYHGVWDRYELYDLEADPDEMHNLLADFFVETEAGPLDRLIDLRASPPVRTIFWDLRDHLRRLLKETGAAPMPRWRETGANE